MKREIKFRGLRKNYNPEYKQDKWMYGNLLNDCSIGEVGYGLDSYTFAEVDPETVGQFTGLKDKNGVEIWEGDIVTHNGINVNARINDYLVIEFKDAAFCITAQNIVTGCDNSCDIREMQFQARRHDLEFIMEVIGNIHENPELL